MPCGDDTWDRIVGKNFYLTSEEDKKICQDRENWVLKPLNDSWGNGISFGSKLSESEWLQALDRALAETNGEFKYGLFEACWLPKVHLPGHGSFAFDFNPTFFIKDDQLDYLYAISRCNPWAQYQREGIINVSKKGSFAGTVGEY
jgi:hypothetical protein